MKWFLFALAVLTISVLSLSACAVPRERSEAPLEQERPVERSARSSHLEQAESELSELLDEQADWQAPGSVSDLLRIGGLGNAESVHALENGQYRCGFTLKNNVQGARPAQFQIEFQSHDPIAAPLVTDVATAVTRGINFVISGSELDGALVQIRVRASPSGEWSMDCRRQSEVNAAFVLNARTEVITDLGTDGSTTTQRLRVSGNGSAVGAMPVSRHEQSCLIEIANNYADDGSTADFIVKIGQQLAVTVTAPAWSGEYQLSIEDWQHRDTVAVSVKAGFVAEWEINCTPS